MAKKAAKPLSPDAERYYYRYLDEVHARVLADTRVHHLEAAVEALTEENARLRLRVKRQFPLAAGKRR